MDGVSTQLPDSLSVNELTGDIEGFDSLQTFWKPEPVKEKTEQEFLADLYDKVGGYYGWSYPEFESTPIDIIYLLNDKIDAKMEAFNNEDENAIFSYQYLATILAISKAFSSKK